MARNRLPVVQEEYVTSLRSDGSRNFVHPADVSGRFTRLRHVVFGVLMVILVALPIVQINGRPAIFLDIANLQFFLFGMAFHAPDFWLAFFLVSGLLFTLIVVTTLWGRVWCGYACPQTVFLEGIYRRIERWIEGPRNERMRRNAGPWTGGKFARKTLKHGLFIAVSLFLAHAFLSYFVSLPAMFTMLSSSPAEHLSAFLWVMITSAALYLNFAWLREQLCLIVCPYGRLQASLTDDDTLIIGYDAKRGEPRGSAKDPNAGDCVDCNRCVVVCPTGIDIRNGLQLECIGCSGCVDACDDVMERLGRPKGLIRYDSIAGFEGRPRRFVRPRVFLYAALGVLGLVVATIAFQSRTTFDATLRRASSSPFVVQGELVLNPMRLHLVNKLDAPQAFRLVHDAPEGVEVLLTQPELQLGAHESRYVSIVARAPRGTLGSGKVLLLRVESRDAPDEVRDLTLPLVGPGQ